MNRGVKSGLRPGEIIPRWAGGEPIYDGVVLGLDSTREGGVIAVGAYRSRYKAGRYFRSRGTHGSNGSISTGTIYLCPVFVDQDMVIDRIGFEVATTNQTSGSTVCGLYTDDGGSYPSRLVISQSLATAAIGQHEFAIWQPVTAGLYWSALLAVTGAPGALIGTTILDQPGTFYDPTQTSTSYINGFTLGGQSTLPDPFPAGAAVLIGSTVCPTAYYRCGAVA